MELLHPSKTKPATPQVSSWDSSVGRGLVQTCRWASAPCLCSSPCWGGGQAGAAELVTLNTEKQQLEEGTIHSSAWKNIPDTWKCHLTVTLPAEGHFHASLGCKCLNKLQFKWEFIWEGKTEVSCGHSHSPGMHWVTSPAVARVCR